MLLGIPTFELQTTVYSCRLFYGTPDAPHTREIFMMILSSLYCDDKLSTNKGIRQPGSYIIEINVDSKIKKKSPLKWMKLVPPLWRESLRTAVIKLPPITTKRACIG
jgi:hypothetical protein